MAGFTALVVEDDPFCAETTVLALKKLGASRVYQAANGAEALAMMGWRSFVDVIVCDLKMPKIDGVETLRNLARHNRAARVIVASAADLRITRAAIDMISEFGIATVTAIEKPITLRNLRDALDLGTPKRRTVRQNTAPDLTEADLIDAFARSQFFAYYQPKVSMTDRHLVGVEALVRWMHPVHGLLAPGAFLPLALSTGKLEELTRLMLRLALTACADWRRKGLTTGVSVNLPMASLLDRDLPDYIDAILATLGLRACQLTLEITEDSWLEPAMIAREVVTRLRIHGFGLAIDDFGTQYSTHQQLLNAPFNELKIDRSFVSRALADRESRIVLGSSIQMARQMGLESVAEGIETRAQWDLLHELGCDSAQGFLIARPMPGEALQDWVRAHGA